MENSDELPMNKCVQTSKAGDAANNRFNAQTPETILSFHGEPYVCGINIYKQHSPSTTIHQSTFPVPITNNNNTGSNETKQTVISLPRKLWYIRPMVQ